MPELETELPLLSESGTDDDWSDSDVIDIEAPWGRKADGTPKKKPGRPSGGGGGSSSSSSTSRSNTDSRLAARIADELIELSAPMAIASPMAMAHVARRADKTGEALVSISKKYPRVKVAIDSYFNSVAYKDLALFVTGIPMCVMADYGIIKPDSKVGIPWHIEEIWLECYSGDDATETQTARAPARGLAAQL